MQGNLPIHLDRESKHRIKEHPYFADRPAVVATRHGKEQVIIPAMDELGLFWLPAGDIDTDQLGTFSGEIPRRDSMRKTAKRKASLGIKLTGAEIGLASEGSFGPHPAVPWIPCDIELIAWYDHTHSWFISESFISLETKFGNITTDNFEELLAFCTKMEFPSHGLVLRPNTSKKKKHIIKGIRSVEQLYQSFETSIKLSRDNKVWAETDMRAHMNPTRMKVIRKAAERLARRLQNYCPKCGLPGFGFQEGIKGLPCSLCGAPTEMIIKERWVCPHCNHSQLFQRADGLREVDPQYCSFCNP